MQAKSFHPNAVLRAYFDKLQGCEFNLGRRHASTNAGVNMSHNHGPENAWFAFGLALRPPRCKFQRVASSTRSCAAASCAASNPKKGKSRDPNEVAASPNPRSSVKPQLCKEGGRKDGNHTCSSVAFCVVCSFCSFRSVSRDSSSLQVWGDRSGQSEKIPFYACFRGSITRALADSSSTVLLLALDHPGQIALAHNWPRPSRSRDFLEST